MSDNIRLSMWNGAISVKKIKVHLPVPKPTTRFADKKKKNNKQACRGGVKNEYSVYQEPVH